MSSSSSTSTPSSKPKKHWKDQLSTLSTQLSSQKYHKCQILSSDLLTSFSSDENNNNDDDNIPDNIVNLVESIHAKSLLHLSKFDDCLNFCKSLRVQRQDAKDEEATFHLAEEEVYALYRLGRYAACRDLCLRMLQKESEGITKEGKIGVQHVYAQCLYRLHEAKNAVNVYESLGEEEEDREEVYTNVMALLIANHSVSIHDEEKEEEMITNILKSGEEEEDVGYDLLYNIATYLLLRGSSTSDVRKALTLLDKAKEECVASLQEEEQDDDDDDDETEEETKEKEKEEELSKELGPIRANKALGLLLLGGDENCQEAKRLYEKLLSSSSSSSGTSAAPSIVAASNNLPLVVNRESLFDSWKRMPTFTFSLSEPSKKKEDSSSTTSFKTPLTTPMQTRIILYNRAILLYKMGKMSEARHVLEVLKKVLKQNAHSVSGGASGTKSRRKKKKGGASSSSSSSSSDTATGGGGGDTGGVENAPPAPPSTNEDGLYWSTKISILESELCRKEDRIEQSTKILNDALIHLQDFAKSNKKGEKNVVVLEYTLAMIKLYQTQLIQCNTTNEKEEEEDDKKKKIESYITTLTTLPPSIQPKPGVIATLASLYNLTGDTTKASSLLESCSKSTTSQAVAKIAMGDFKFQLGLYDDAAQLYESFLLEEEEKENEMTEEEIMVVTAKLVRALSFVDEEKAEEYAERLPSAVGNEGNEDDEEGEEDKVLDGEELEGRDIPRISKKIGKRAILSGGGGGEKGRRDGEQKKKKSHEAVLRQRAKKREAYLKKLEAEGKYNPDRPTKPDPERWIPKNQRSYNRRGRRGRHKFVGAQGGGTGVGADRDAAKLDAAARAAERNAGGGASSKPSTAHVKVGASSAVRKGGKKRR